MQDMLQTYKRANWGLENDRSFCFQIQKLLFTEDEVIGKSATGKGKKIGIDKAKKCYLIGIFVCENILKLF